jgi:hypothetical protein
VTDLPADVAATLSQLLAEGGEYARRRETGATLDVADTVARVAETKVPDEELRGQLVHGCARVRETAADEPLVAAAYLDSMHGLVNGDRNGG